MSADLSSAEIARMRGIVKELLEPRIGIFWADLVVSTLLGWGALVGAVLTRGLTSALLAALAMLAMWRAVQFIHELVHLPQAQAPGIHLFWNAFVGMPFFLPMFMFETHFEHHRTRTFGTVDDPEYVKVPSKGRGYLVLFMLEGFIAPVLLFVRFALVAPLSWLAPPVRRWALGRASTLGMNHDFLRRDLPERKDWRGYEVLTTAWAVTFIGLIASGTLSWRSTAVIAAIAAGVAVLDQAKTLVVHRFRCDGTPVTFGAQTLDAVNIEGGPWSELWAPLGNRFHALHHLFPSMPYHAMARAHRRLSAQLPKDHPYHLTIERSLGSSLASILRSQGAQ